MNEWLISLYRTTPELLVEQELAPLPDVQMVMMNGTVSYFVQVQMRVERLVFAVLIHFIPEPSFHARVFT